MAAQVMTAQAVDNCQPVPGPSHDRVQPSTAVPTEQPVTETLRNTVPAKSTTDTVHVDDAQDTSTLLLDAYGMNSQPVQIYVTSESNVEQVINPELLTVTSAYETHPEPPVIKNVNYESGLPEYSVVQKETLVIVQDTDPSQSEADTESEINEEKGEVVTKSKRPSRLRKAKKGYNL